MSKVGTSDLWEPTVLGRTRLNERWCAYLVKAPFDMPVDNDGLLGSVVELDGMAFRIGGTVAHTPPRPIRAGESIQILVTQVDLRP